MYEFHFDYIKNAYGNNSRLRLFSDTDSLMIKLKTESAYEDFNKDKKMFDFSKYSTKWKFYDDSNKIVFDKTKDETAGVSIKEFFGLERKTYFFLLQ